MELQLKHDVLHHHVAFIYNQGYAVKMYQANLFEQLRADPHCRARMKRGGDRGHLRDSWKYDISGKLIEYTKYSAFSVACVGDSHSLAGEDITKFVFLDGLWEGSTINHMLNHLGNTSGKYKPLDETLVKEPLGVRYFTNFQE